MIQPSLQLRTPWLPIALASGGLALAVALVLASSSVPGLLRLESSTADIRTALLSYRTTAEHPGVAVVAISDETLKSFATKSPIDRGLLASLVTAIDSAGPRAIGLDVYFLRRTEDDKDRALQSALRDAKAVVVPGALDERGRMTPEQKVYQDEFLASTRRPAGFLALQFDRDGVVRTIAGPAPATRYPDSLPVLLARAIKSNVEPPAGRIAWLQLVEPTALLSTFVNWEGRNPFPVIAAEDVLDPKRQDLRDKLEGRIVLIGADFAYIDRHRTPLTVWSGEETAGVMVHAQVVAQLLDARAVSDVTPANARLVALALACLGGLLGWRFRFRRFDFLGWSIAAAGLTAIDALIFSNAHVILPFMVSMLAWFAGVTAGHNLGHIYDWELKRAGQRA